MENTQKIQTEITQLAGTEVSFIIPNTEQLGKLETLEDKFSLTMRYKTADDWAAIKDKEVRCFFMGMKSIPNENGESVNCGVFVTKNECFIAGPLTLVEAVKNLTSGTPISITYKGKKANTSSNGSTMLFEVKTLG